MYNFGGVFGLATGDGAGFNVFAWGTWRCGCGLV